MPNKSDYFRSGRAAFSKTLRFAAIAFILILMLLTPVQAQSAGKAPVVLDGRQIFQVSDSENFTAKERADQINFQLKAVVQSLEPPAVSVEERNQVPTILVNDRYLLTVTQRDVEPGSNPDEQARAWAEQIKTLVGQAQAERSAQFTQNALLNSAGILLVAIALHWGLGQLWRLFLRNLLQMFRSVGHERDHPDQPSALDLLLKLTLAIARTGLWVATALYITNLFPLTRRWSYRITNSLIASFTSPILTLGQRAYSITDLLILMGLLLGLVAFASFVTNLLRSRILQVTRINQGAQEAVTIITKYTLIFVGTIVLLQVWGLDLSSLAILASALGVGIGFGFQDIAKNFGSGLVLIFERPIQVGDFIEVSDYKGTVERIGARSTVIRTLDRISIIVPNSRFLETEVINWSHRNSISRLHLPVGVAYGSNTSTVKAALLDAAKDHPDVLTVPPPRVFFIGFGSNSLDFELLVWIAEPSKQYLFKSDLYFRIEAMLRQHQIEVPFPQRDLNIRSGSLSVELSSELEQVLLQLSQQLAARSQLNDIKPEKSDQPEQ